MKDKHVSIPMTILSLAIGIIVIFPIIWLVLSSFKPSGELFTYPLHMFPSAPTTEHYKSVLDGGFIGYVKNSLFLAVVGTLITLLISAMCGYALAIYRFEIKYVNLVFGVFLLGTLIPGETLTVPQFSVISAMGLYLGRHPACCHHYDRYLHVPPALYVVAAVSGRGRAYRRCQRVEDLLQHHAASGLQRHHHADDLQLHVALERLHPAAAGFV